MPDAAEDTQQTVVDLLEEALSELKAIRAGMEILIAEIRAQKTVEPLRNIIEERER